MYPFFKLDESFCKLRGADGKTAASILNDKSLFGPSPFEFTAEYCIE